MASLRFKPFAGLLSLGFSTQPTVTGLERRAVEVDDLRVISLSESSARTIRQRLNIQCMPLERRVATH